MAKEATTTAQPDEAAAPLPLTLVEFCSRLSATIRRPELISAFAASERKAGNVSGTEPEFQARYEAFCNAPA